MLISLSNVWNLLQNDQLPIFCQILVAIFVTVEMAKVELIPDKLSLSEGFKYCRML